MNVAFSAAMASSGMSNTYSSLAVRSASSSRASTEAYVRHEVELNQRSDVVFSSPLQGLPSNHSSNFWGIVLSREAAAI